VSLLEETLEIIHRLALAREAFGAPALAWRKPIAAIGAVALGHPLGTRLGALVVGGWVMMATVLAGVEIGPALIAAFAKTNLRAASGLDLEVAAYAFHCANLRHSGRRCQARGMAASESGA
jgi:hypothetical protein